MACLSVASTALATPTVTQSSDSHGKYYVINNGNITFQLYSTCALAGEITSLTYDGQQMVGSKDFYYDIQGSPGFALGSSETYSYTTGSNYVDITAFHPANGTEPVDVTWHWIVRDGDAGYSSYLTYHHTTAMADWGSSENRLGAQFYNPNLFNYTSVADNFWGYQAAGNADRDEGVWITKETSDMEGIPSEYIKNYETKYDWRTTYAQAGGVTGIFTAPNDTLSTKPFATSDYGAWTIVNPRGYENWNAGPTHPQTPVADGASIIPSPPGSHFGGPTMVMTGNMDQTYGPIFNYFNKGSNITDLRNDAKQYASPTAAGVYNLNAFYDSINLPYYASTTQRGMVTGNVRIADGQSMNGATVVLSYFDPTAYASSPISQEYQRRAIGYNYWITPNADGTFTIPDVRPGTYRVTVIKPGNYREGTFDNIVVTGNSTTNVGRLLWQPDVSGKGQWQIGTFDRTAGEFHDGTNYNNWLGTFNEPKEFPNGVTYTVNPSNPFNDTAQCRSNWPLYQENGTLDFFHVNFNMSSLPAPGSTVTFTVSIAAQEFINSLGFSMNGASQIYASFDHTADNAPSTYRSGDTSSAVMYRKINLTVGANGALSWGGTSYGSLVVGNNSLQLHIVGGNMQWDAIRMDVTDPGTHSLSQWNGGNGNWSDASQWSTQQYGYTNINKGAATINGITNPEYGNDTSTTFLDGATQTAPINNTASQLYYDAFINGGTVNLDTSPTVQKLSLLNGTLNVSSGTPTITANDTVVLGGGTFNGSGTINASNATTVNFANTISGGAKIASSGAVTWLDQGAVTVTGSGSKWTVPGMTIGSGASNSLTINSGAMVSAGASAITFATGATVTIGSGSTLTAGSLNNSGALSSNGTVSLTGVLTNSGSATIGALTASSVVNTGGTLVLNGPSTYSGGTSVTGGIVQFASTSAIGGSGANVSVGSGGAVNFASGITNSAFLSRISTTSTGSLALSSVDASTNLDFTSGTLSPLSQMSIGAIGNVTYSGTYTPAGGIYRLGGGGGTLTYSPKISGSSAVIIGNTGTTGSVLTNSANNYTGTTTIKGGTLSASLLTLGGFNSSIGASSNAPANLVIDGGALAYTGSGDVTDHLLTIGPGGATIIANGTGAITFNNNASLAPSGNGDRTFTLIASSTQSGDNIFYPGIGDPTGGKTSLVKDGAGSWVFTGAAKTYSGDTTILSGILKFSNASNALAFGPGKGNLNIATGANFDLNGTNQNINGLNDGPLASGASWPTPNGPGGGNIINTGSSTSTFTIGNGDAAGLFSGVIGGNLNLVKTGNGTQTLSGDNTYTGTTTINAGTLQVGIGGTPSSYGPGDGGFRGMLGSGTVINNATLVFNRGYLTTCSNVITGTGTLKQIANAELVLGSSNTYTGPTVIGDRIANIGLGGPNDGTGLAYSGDCSLNASALANGGIASSIGSSSNAASNLVLDGGTLFYTGSTTSTDRLFTVTQNGGCIYANGGITFTNTGSIVMSGSGDRTIELAGETTTNSTFNPSIGDPALGGVTTLRKNRSAPWTLGSSSQLTYSGDTQMWMGVLKMGATNQLPFGDGKGNVSFATVTDFNSVYDPVLELNGFDQNINALTGGLTGYGSVDNNVAGAHTLTVGNGDASGDFLGTLTGSLNLTKTGAGSQTFEGVNTNTGSTTVNGGALIFTATAAIGGSAKNVSINNGATLGLPGSMLNQTLLNRITSTSTGVLALTADDANNLDFSSSGANLASVSLGAIGSVNYTGTLTPNGTKFKLGGGGGTLTISTALTGTSNSLTIGSAGNLNGPAGTVILAATNTYGGATTVAAGTLEVNSLASIGGTGPSVTVNSGAIMAAGYPIDQTFLGRISSASTGTIALNVASANNLNFASGNLSNVSLGAISNVTYTGLLTAAGNGYKLGGGGATLTIGTANALTGANPVQIMPASQVAIAATQNYSAATTIGSGATLTISSLANGGVASPLGASTNASSNLLFDGGTLYVSASGNSDRGLTVTQNGGGITTPYGVTFSFGGAIVSSGTGDRTFTVYDDGSNTTNSYVNGNITDPAGGGKLSFVKDGGARLWFETAAATYSGDTIIKNGRLYLNGSNFLPYGTGKGNVVINAGGYLGLFNNNTNINGLYGSGQLDQGGTNTRGLTLGNGNADGSYTGTITTSGSVFSVTKVGTGTQILAGNNIYNGTTISGGALQIGSGGTSGTLGTGAVTDNAKLIFDRSDNITLANLISGTGSFTQTGTGTLTLSAANTYTGGTSIQAGTLQLGVVNSLPSAGNITVGAGTLNLGNLAPTYSGNITVQGGSITAGTINKSGAAYDVQSGSISAILAGAVGVTKSTSATVSLTNSNIYTGDTLINAGILDAASSASLGSASNKISFAGGTLRTDSSFNTSRGIVVNSPSGTIDTNNFNSTFTGSITGAGALNKTGSGNLTVTNVRSSGLNISAGAVAIKAGGGNTGTSVLSSLSIAPGATLDVADHSMIVNYSGTSPLTSIRAAITSAYDAGKWDLPGLTSSVAATDANSRTGIGYVEASDLGLDKGGTFAGQAVTGQAVLVKYTYYGDQNLDGVCNLDDFSIFIDGFNGLGSGWIYGDFNYDGLINQDDFSIFANSFNRSGQPLSVLTSAILGDPELSSSQKANLLNAVPEPTSLGVMCLAAGFCTGQRRKKLSRGPR